MIGIGTNITVTAGTNLITEWRSLKWYNDATDTLQLGTSSNYIDFVYKSVTVGKGNKVSLSVECKGSGKFGFHMLGVSNKENITASPLGDTKDAKNNGHVVFNLTDNWQKFWVTYTASRDYTSNGWNDYVLMRCDIGSTLEARNPKIELGPYPTDIE